MIAFLQARSNSRRYPRKILEPLQDSPLILFQISRIRKSLLVDYVVVLTSLEHSDDELCRLLDSQNISYFRGDLNDVHLRFRQALAFFGIDSGYIMRLTADCPLICPEILDSGVEAIKQSDFNYFSNTVIRTFPDGLDFEILRVEDFLNQPRACLTDYDKEHVTPYFYNNPNLYSIGQLISTIDNSSIRITVDFPQDLVLVSEMVGNKAFDQSDRSYSHLLELYTITMKARGNCKEFNREQVFRIKKLGVNL
jgi:spore coat polysaccharide biosynthesis protein SpsF